jgi:hypothetical protein
MKPHVSRKGSIPMNTQWVEVRSCMWLHEAELFKSVLEAAGIEAMIPNEYSAGVQPFYATAIGGLKVLVQSEDADRAREVLDCSADVQGETDGGDDA